MSDQGQFIVMLSHELFQGCTILVDSSVLTLSLLEQEAIISTRMREKLAHGLLALNMSLLVASRVDTMNVHLHQPLQLGVVNWVCDNSYCKL